MSLGAQEHAEVAESPGVSLRWHRWPLPFSSPNQHEMGRWRLTPLPKAQPRPGDGGSRH